MPKPHTKGTTLTEKQWAEMAAAGRVKGEHPGPERFDLESWKASRSRVGVKEMVTVGKTDKFPEKNSGLPDGPFETDHLHNTCTKCKDKYKYIGEVEWHGGMDCCSGLCD